MLPLSRDEALEFLKSMPQLESDMNHYLESEAIMRALAERLGEDAEYGGMIGLLHDVDWALTKDDLGEHCVKVVEVLKEKGFDDEFIEIVQSHAYGMDIIPTLKEKKRAKKIEYALVAAETLTGLIYAYALMRGGRVSDMEAKGLKKKFKDKAFAAKCDRELIREIEKAGLAPNGHGSTDPDLSEFFEISIRAVSGIKGDIGLE